MERLTNKEEFCDAICPNPYECEIECNFKDIKDMYNKLKEYEDLEEQGLLLKLPCKIGSIVYVVGTKCLKGEEPIGGCGKNICDGCILNETYTVFETDADTHLMKLLLFEHNENFIFNKTVFLTREEAEKALERLECTE